MTVLAALAVRPHRQRPDVQQSLLLVRRGLRDSRTRIVTFGYLFAVYAYVQPVGYRHTYKTPLERAVFVHSFGDNPGLRLLYGLPRRLDTTAGYTAWRVGGVLAVAAAFFGLLAAVRATRAEEEAGRTEVVLSAPVSRTTATTALWSLIAAGTGVVWVAEFAGLLIARLPAGGAAALATSTAAVSVVFAAIGALGAQLAGTRRGAMAVGGAAVAAAFLLRILADTVSGAGWLGWLTPLGWAERLQPSTGFRPWVLVLPAAATAVLAAVAARWSRSRDIGAGLFPGRDWAEPHLALLRSPALLALRTQRGVLIAWLGATASFLAILGVVSHSLSSADVPDNVRRQLEKLGVGSIITPKGYMSFLFLIVVLVITLFAATQISGLRQDEIQHLETVLAGPIGRTAWLLQRLALTLLAAASLALTAGFAAWGGGVAAGIHLGLAGMLEAGANAIPITVLFLGPGVLAYGVAPRMAPGLTYVLIAVSFLWQLVGSLLSPPRWVLDLSPFAHLALVPTQRFQALSAAVMAGLGAVAAALAIAAFRRRDLIGD
ncbi:MAG TPA: hypothetical protein VG650_11640 [Mycobacteriales bacterium]|nr:hypothetical protein [Mycobacteriales bacterium]